MIIMFPGQGSQFVGMGGGLFKKFSGLTEDAGGVLGYSIEDVCSMNYDQLKQTQYTQPAIFTVSILMYLDFLERWNNPCISALIGHSLGEYTALCASGAFDFKTGLQLVKKRGEIMQAVTGSAMAAIVGLSIDAVNEVLLKENRNVHVANYNSKNQVVISGDFEHIHDLQKVFSSCLSSGMSYHILPVSGAFHSPFMDGPAGEFLEFLNKNDFKMCEPQIPVIANWNKEVYTAEVLKENLVKQINHPVLWVQSIEKLIQTGETLFYEVGPRNIISNLMK